MNQKTLDRIVQAVVALGVLALLGWMVQRGEIDSTAVITVVTVILAGFGFEAGRRVQYKRRR